MDASNAMPRVLVWLIGGLSLVSLVQSSISLLLHPSIQLLIGSYGLAVGEFFKFLTGWIGLPWFNVSRVEQHFIVILVICQSALLNSSRRYRESHLLFAAGVVLFAIADTIVFGIMPDSFILTPLFVAGLMLFLPFYLERTGELRLQNYHVNLIGITIFFLVITTVNYVMTIV